MLVLLLNYNKYKISIILNKLSKLYTNIIVL